MAEPVGWTAHGTRPGEVEQTLAALWTTLLAPDRPVSAQDNFFALGGDSMLSIRVRAALDAFVADRLVRIDGGTVRITEAGRPFVRAVCAAFDPLVQASAKRHARVV